MTNTSTSMADFISESNISFNGGDLSSDTGVLLPLDFVFNNHLLDLYSDLPYDDERSSSKAHNSNFSLFIQIIIRFISGYFTQADQSVLETDPILSRYVGPVSSQSSVSRFFKRISEETLNVFWKNFMDQSCSFVDQNLEDILLDADSTKTDVYGHQDGASYIHHYSQVGYHPAVINEFNSEVLVGSFLRPGSAGSAEEAVPIMEEILSRISDTAADGKPRTISFRGDAAFYNGSLMELFEDRANPVSYAIRAKGTGRLDGVCIGDYQKSNTEEDFTWTSARPFYGETSYLMSGSKKARRVCYKLWFSEEEDRKGQICLIPHVFAVITNINEMTPAQVIEFYCQRGTSENFTKELKDDFNAGTLSHRSFEANAFEFLLKSLAYNLFHMFQFLVLEGRDRKMKASSFRKKYQKAASRLSSHARTLHLKIASSFRFKDEFMYYLKKSRRIRLAAG